MACSIRDVAKMAGVSVGTVSRVINGFDNIAPERIDAVREAIRVLGYRKNSAAQLLALTLTKIYDQNLSVDCFYLHGSDTKLPSPRAGFWSGLATGAQQFFYS